MQPKAKAVVCSPKESSAIQRVISKCSECLKYQERTRRSPSSPVEFFVDPDRSLVEAYLNWNLTHIWLWLIANLRFPELDFWTTSQLVLLLQTWNLVALRQMKLLLAICPPQASRSVNLQMSGSISVKQDQSINQSINFIYARIFRIASKC